MNNQDYNTLVNETFCSNAIRSVMLIDDDFITYSNSIKFLIEGNNIEEKKIDGSKRAAQLEKFFQEKNILCDINDGSVNFDIERIKKSDLIIIDYQLESNSSRKTLETLYNLKNSPQFNLIVVYTNEVLDKAWKEICTCFANLKPSSIIINEINDFDISQYWDEIIVPNINNNGDFSLTEPESVNSLKGTYPTARLSTLLFSDPNFNKNSVLINNKSKIIDAIISYNLDKYKILDFKPEEDSNVVITGDCDEYKWIKSGNVFISLFNKSKELTINEAEEIWNNLVNSIYKWRPSYYNIIKSEIQNKIEAEALSFEVHLANDVYGQAAWLNEILKNTDTETRKEKIDFIFRNIAEELYFKLRENSDLNNFIDNVFTHFENVFNSKNFEDNIENNRLRFCAESMNLTYGDACNNDMYHALNMNTSSRNYREKYLTTGTILYNEENNEWYLCVSAACDMVPSQGNDAYHKRLKPHRLVQMLRLFECDATNAISNASHSKYIYVYEKSLTPPRKYYSVTNPTTNLPQIDYIVVLNHTTQKNVRSVQAVVLNANGNEVIPTTITLKLKSQLRTGYAERYQLIASQYGGRIGVDYFGINIIDE